MLVTLLSKQAFLKKELLTLKDNYIINFASDTNDIYKLMQRDTTFILLHHLDDDINFKITSVELKEEYPNIRLVALRNNTNNIEGCSLLKNGYKGYLHSLSNSIIINDVISSVKENNTWVYPELMQFLISSIPLNDINKNSFLDRISIKELEVLELVSEGLNNQNISNTLNIAEVTVKKHISSLFKKLEQSDRLSLALYFKQIKA